jgi:hypothetical protein
MLDEQSKVIAMFGSKAAKREARRVKSRFKPRGNPKFLHLLMQEERKRLEKYAR